MFLYQIYNQYVSLKKQNPTCVYLFTFLFLHFFFNLGELKAESEEESELSELEEGELFDDQDKNTEDLNSSEYTYSSLTLSFSEYLNIREAYYNDNSYEKIFYPKDPKMNVTYIYDTVDFYNISKGKVIREKSL